MRGGQSQRVGGQRAALARADECDCAPRHDAMTSARARARLDIDHQVAVALIHKLDGTHRVRVVAGLERAGFVGVHGRGEVARRGDRVRLARRAEKRRRRRRRPVRHWLPRVVRLLRVGCVPIKECASDRADTGGEKHEQDAERQTREPGRARPRACYPQASKGKRPDARAVPVVAVGERFAVVASGAATREDRLDALEERRTITARRCPQERLVPRFAHFDPTTRVSISLSPIESTRKCLLLIPRR
jgi:hypothetical protein